jgi:ligand-binding sensor domain-containing protein
MKTLMKLVLVLLLGMLTNTEIYGSVISINTGGIDGEVKKKENGKFEKSISAAKAKGKADVILAKPKITMPSNSKIRCMYEDAKANIWIGTDGDGILKFDGKKFTKYTIVEGLSSNHVRSIIQDNVGNFWISTSEGLDVFNGMFFKNILTDKSPGFKSSACGYKDKAGILWFGTNDGVYKINNFTLEYISISAEAGNKKTNRAYSVHSITQDRNGIFWFGTEFNGLCRYDGQSISFIKEKGLNEGAIRSILIDKQGLMWIGNSAGSLYTYNGKVLKNFSENANLKNNEHANKLNRIWTIKEDTYGKIWIGTLENGVWTIENNTLKNYDKKDQLPSEGILHIFIDKRNKMWFGGENGAVYEFKKNMFQEVFLRDNC